MKLSRIVTLVIALVFTLCVLPVGAGAADYPKIIPAKTTVTVGERLNLTVVTSKNVDKIQTVIDGEQGSVYTNYTEKEDLRNWSTRITFTDPGKRSIAYDAYMNTGKIVRIKAVTIDVKEKEEPDEDDEEEEDPKEDPSKYTAKASGTTSMPGDVVTFELTTPEGVTAIMPVVDGVNQKRVTGKGKTWSIPIKFNKAGTRKVSFVAYKGDKSVQTFPKSPISIKVGAVKNVYKIIEKPAYAKTYEPAKFIFMAPSNITKCVLESNDMELVHSTNGKDNGDGTKTFTLVAYFDEPGTADIQIMLYQGDKLVSRYPSAPVAFKVVAGAPIVREFSMNATAFSPGISENPTFTIRVDNSPKVTLEIYNDNDKLVTRLLNKQLGNESVDVVWSNPELGEYTAKLTLENDSEKVTESIEFKVAESTKPVLNMATPQDGDVAFDTALFFGTVSSTGNTPIIEAGFMIGTTSGKYTQNIPIAIDLSSIQDGRVFCGEVDGLATSTTYYVKAYAQNLAGLKGYSREVTITTGNVAIGFTAADSMVATLKEEEALIFNASSKDGVLKNKAPAYDSSANASRAMDTAYMPIWNKDGNPATRAVTTNRRLIPALRSIMAEIFNLDIDFKVVDLSSFSYRNVNTPTGESSNLSQHAYGTAIDFNAEANPHVVSGDPRDPSSPYTVPAEVVEIFNRHGWMWGGDYTKTKDYMHFQYVSVPYALTE